MLVTNNYNRIKTLINKTIYKNGMINDKSCFHINVPKLNSAKQTIYL